MKQGLPPCFLLADLDGFEHFFVYLEERPAVQSPVRPMRKKTKVLVTFWGCPGILISGFEAHCTSESK